MLKPFGVVIFLVNGETRVHECIGCCDTQRWRHVSLVLQLS